MGEMEEVIQEIEREESFTPPDIETRDRIVAHILTLICLSNTVVCFFIILVIKLSKKLRLQFYTGCVLHCNIVMSGYLMLISILSYLWLFKPKLYFQKTEYFKRGIVLLSGQHILYACMAIDFALVAYDKSKSQKFRRNFNLIIIVVYVYIIFFGAFIYQILCHYKPNINIHGYVGATTLLFYFLTITIVSSKYLYKRIKYSVLVDATPLTISLSHFVWLLLFIMPFITPSYYFIIFCHILWVSQPLILFMLWYFVDINFRACAKDAIKCKYKKYVEGENVVDDTVTGAVHGHQNSEAQVP